MTEFFKALKKNMIITSIAFIVLGIVFILFSQQVSLFACYVIGAVILGFGVIRIVNYVRKLADTPYGSTGLALGIVLSVAGVFIICNPDIVNKWLSFVAGAIIIIDGAVKLQRSLDYKKCGASNWWGAFAVALIILLAGLFIVLNPAFMANAVIIVIGCVFVFSGISDLWTTFFVVRKVKEEEVERKIIEVDYTPVEDEDD